MQLSQEDDSTEFPFTFLSHTILKTQRKWSITEQEAYGVYYAITKWNDYLWGTDIILQNYHKPLYKFLNGKMQKTRSIDGDWSYQFTISPLNGFLEHAIKQPIVFHA